MNTVIRASRVPIPGEWAVRVLPGQHLRLGRRTRRGAALSGNLSRLGDLVGQRAHVRVRLGVQSPFDRTQLDPQGPARLLTSTG